MQARSYICIFVVHIAPIYTDKLNCKRMSPIKSISISWTIIRYSVIIYRIIWPDGNSTFIRLLDFYLGGLCPNRPYLATSTTHAHFAMVKWYSEPSNDHKWSQILPFKCSYSLWYITSCAVVTPCLFVCPYVRPAFRSSMRETFEVSVHSQINRNWHWAQMWRTNSSCDVPALYNVWLCSTVSWPLVGWKVRICAHL